MGWTLAVAVAILTTATEAQVASSDIAITVNVYPNPVFAGQVVEFSGTVINLGPDDAERIQFRLPGPYPQLFEHVLTATEPEAQCITETGSVVCEFPVLAPGEEIRYRVLLRVDTAFYGLTGGVFEGAVQATLLGSSNIDPNANNVATFLLVIWLASVPGIPTLSGLGVGLFLALLSAAALLRLS